MGSVVNELFEVRQQAHYYRAQHMRACRRESLLKERVGEIERVVRSQERQIDRLMQRVETLKARIVWLERQVFGQKSESSREGGSESCEGERESTSGSDCKDNRHRGQQPGRRSCGRKRHTQLPTEQIVHELPESERFCPRCGLPFDGFPGTEDSEEVHWEVRLVRHVHKRKRYLRTCQCPDVPGIVSAPLPAKLIPKGKFSTEFWARILEQKYLFQIPLHRTLKMLELEGLHLSQGTITDNLKRIGELVQPLYAGILEHSRNAAHWHMDETGWKVFEEQEGKRGHRWWLWVVVTTETCVYLLDPTRSALVPKSFLGQGRQGTISVDRYSAYKSLLSALLRLAYCWAHVRRDFVRIGEGYGGLRRWATAWVERIEGLFHCNGERIDARANPEQFCKHDQALRAQLDAVEQMCHEQLAEQSLHPAARKALKSMKKHWDGLVIFVDNPDIPMDNNKAERAVRNPVVGRKNYYGSGSVWSGMFSVMMFTLFQTLLLNDINPHQYLLAYFEVCARNKGHPPEDIKQFLPWKFRQEHAQPA